MEVAENRAAEWAATRPHFQRMLFMLGFRETRALCHVSVGNLYKLANGNQVPTENNLRAIKDAVGTFSQSERAG